MNCCRNSAYDKLVKEMRKPLQTLILLLLTLPLTALAQNPTKWSLDPPNKGGIIDTEEDHRRADKGLALVLYLSLKVEIEEGWRLYALNQPAGGPIATTVVVPDGSSYTIHGKIRAQTPKSKPDQISL